MIDLKNKLDTLKSKATKLMNMGAVTEYIKTLCEINKIQLQLVTTRSK